MKEQKSYERQHFDEETCVIGHPVSETLSCLVPDIVQVLIPQKPEQVLWEGFSKMAGLGSPNQPRLRSSKGTPTPKNVFFGVFRLLALMVIITFYDSTHDNENEMRIIKV